MALDVPVHLLEEMPDWQRDETASWWAELSEDARRDFLRMWDGRAGDTAYFGFIEEGRIVWEQLPLELVGEFVEPDSAEMDHDEIKQQLLEYVNGHSFDFFLLERRFHICRAHPAARSLVRDGLIPHDFVCPLGRSTCPVRELLSLSPGHDIELCVRLSTSRRVGSRVGVRHHEQE